MSGASRLFWPLLLVAALPLLLIGCGGSVDPNANTQFRPVDDEGPVAAKESTPKAGGPVKPPVTIDPSLPEQGPGASTSAKATRTKSSGASKPSGTAKATTGTSGKGTSSLSPATTGEATSGDDPALVGPTGTKVKRIRALLRSLGGKLEGDTQEAKMQYLMKVLQQTMMTAEEVVGDEKAPAAARDEALLARFQVASMMMQAGPPEEAKEILAQVATDLSKAENSQFATLGRVQLFKLHVLDVLKAQPADASDVLTALDTLLEAGGDINVITSEVMPLVTQLEQFGYGKDGVAAITKIGDHYADSKDANEAIIGKQLQVSGLVGKLRQGEGNASEVGEQLVAKAREIVEASDADKGGINLLYQLAHNQEGDYPEVAGKLYDLIEEKYGESTDEKVANKVKELIVSARQRMTLVGKPLEVTGQLIDDSEPFDWSKYQGKVVLIHFWSVANRASLQDIGDKDRLYRRYARRGLSIIGINLDVKVADAHDLLDAQPQPLSWPMVTGENPSQRGFKHPTAQACGMTAESLPYTVLIGRDGKVAAAGLQGPQLDEAIVKLLAAKGEQPEEKSADTPGDEKTDSDAKNKDSESKSEEESK